ncbi:uncharacterized protein LAJ45_09501 [Morchella importuna]|uniref:uncharacterized protein n=1 Tax=Morchella importuna TaxID=1174673 RepID=UPI001E8DD261|nr:uncharacterized protein LAJ45_09501 [Morchella importuna]KAH8146555.1 hypothetical protein LAJ45_09501 [Morchella importuna]
MADLSPPSSSLEETHGRQQRQHSSPLLLLRSISSEEQLVGGGGVCGLAAAAAAGAPASGETPPTPPATTRASTAISGAAETDNEEEEDFDEQETTVGRAAPVVDERQHPEPVFVVPEPQRAPPSPPTLSLPAVAAAAAAAAAVVDITTTPATPQAQEEEEELSMPSIKTVPKRDGPKQSSSSSSKPRPAPVSLPLPPLRQVSDTHSSTTTTTSTTITSTTTPLSPSSLSRVLREEGIRSPSHPSITALPPSPPLTRRGTNNTRTTSSSRYGPQAIAVRGGSPDKLGALRPGTSSSNASLKDVSRMGKKLGRQPIDYLLPNGSLPNPVSTNFHPWQEPDSLDDSPDTDQPVSAVFANLNILLENYHSILSNGGSIAVANGYHSVARKLLEQVGGVFTRDLGVDGVGWHDILEYIRGGRTRPCLCVLPVKGLMSRRNIEASILSGATGDDDVASHLHPPSMYITKELAQSVVAGVKQKTGKVEDWLEEVEKVLKRSQPPPSPTTASALSDDGEFDEHSEIVVQIIEGILNQTQILIFRAYLSDPHILAATKLALVRLYPQHTPAAITAPIIALYLLLHDELHPLLTAVSRLTDAEMELINSGRFDGFLDGSSNAVPRDEEEELRTITSLDRSLLRVLEGLDDEIEELHNRALIVRRALKERQNGIAKKMKKRSMQQLAEGEVSSSTPTPLPDELEDENELLLPPVEEWEGGKSILLGPDDSASNVTFNRRRRAERRIEKEKEEAERKKAEKKARRIEERDEASGKRERKKRTDEEDAIAEDDDDATVDGRSVHRKERKEKKERREKHHCDGKDSCDDCSSSAAAKRSRSGGRREEPETIKEETKEELKELKEKTSKSSSTKETKDKHRHKTPKEEKEKDAKKGGLFGAARRLFDGGVTADKPSKSDKEKDKDRPATGSSGKSSERERPPTSQSHRGGGHSHREGDHHRDIHREIKI